jgi:hypothetical protein
MEITFYVWWLGSPRLYSYLNVDSTSTLVVVRVPDSSISVFLIIRVETVMEGYDYSLKQYHPICLHLSMIVGAV